MAVVYFACMEIYFGGGFIVIFNGIFTDIFNENIFAILCAENCHSLCALTEKKEVSNNANATKESAKERLSELVGLTLSAIARDTTGEKLKEFCKVSSNLLASNISFKSALLAFAQKPESTHLMGYEEWKTVGRQVKQGAKSVQVFAPKYVKEYS